VTCGKFDRSERRFSVHGTHRLIASDVLSHLGHGKILLALKICSSLYGSEFKTLQPVHHLIRPKIAFFYDRDARVDAIPMKASIKGIRADLVAMEQNGLWLISDQEPGKCFAG